MLDQHEGHAAVGRHRGEERLEGVDAARRGAKADDQTGAIVRRLALGTFALDAGTGLLSAFGAQFTRLRRALRHEANSFPDRGDDPAGRSTSGKTSSSTS